MAQAWHRMTAADLGRGIAQGSVCPVELAEAALEATGRHPAGDRIYARLMPERALAEAAAARDRARAGHRLSPLDGVPISWKDLFDTAGVKTEAGSKLLEGRVPERDAAVVQAATGAGLCCLGKTHMTELAFSGLGANPSTASPPNINAADAVSGGSSSGAAASVAHGIAPAGVGSDTAGSVRLPAAWNDLVGLKTTPGRLSNAGVVPLCPRFDTVGPLTRSVEDAALIFEALGGGATDLAGATLAGRRFVVLETVAMEGLEGHVAPGFEGALERLSAAGAEIEHRAVPEVGRAVELALILFATEAYGTWKEVIEAAPEKMFANILERFRGGAAFSGADYVAAWQRLVHLRATYHAAVADADAVVMPTCAIMPPHLAAVLADPEHFAERNLKTLRNTRIGSLMGLPGLTLPTGTPSVGLLMQGPPGAEERLLRLGAAAERALA
ncbi:MAG: amidase family protein [Pseudomonadota bacterium]